MHETTAPSQQLERVQSSLVISCEQWAQTLGTDQETVDRWLAKEMVPQAEHQARLDALDVLATRLDDTFKTPAGVAAWLHAPSGYLGGSRPIDALLQERIDAVDAALEVLDSGIFV